MNLTLASPGRLAILRAELAKLPAFLRRDFLQAWSYRMAFATDAIGLAVQAVTFLYIGKMVDPAVLPTFGGARVSYLEFAAVGIAISMFVSLGVGRVAGAIRSEQLMGTLESVLMTPTAPATIQLGSVVYDLVYIPLRTAIFLVVIGVAFGLHFQAAGFLPAAIVLLFFIPFVWGFGILSAAALLTFKRGGTGVGFGVTLMTLISGAYFPLALFPGWLQAIAEWNPMALTITGIREPLLGEPTWSSVAPALAALIPAAAVTLVLGVVAFQLALRRERRTGSLGLY